MPLMPFQVLGIWLRGLLSLAILGAIVYLFRSWDEHRHVVVREPARVVTTVDAPAEGAPAVVDGPRIEPARPTGAARVVTVPFGWNRPSAEFLGAIALSLLSIGGGRLVYPLIRKPGGDDPKAEHGGEVRSIDRPDGTKLHVEMFGPADAPPIVLTHGWGADLTEWYYVKRELGDRFRLILWDLPGMGLSKGPDNNDYSLEKMAGDLHAVLGLAGGRPAILLGHSIGGMTTLVFSRLFPGDLGSRVAGLVLVHTTYTNPVETTQMRWLYVPLQKPLLEPLCRLMIWLSPVVWALNWLSYFNGSLQRSNDKHTFCGTETRGQLDFVSKFMPKSWPANVARGMFGMFHYDETKTLGSIGVPTLVVAADKDETCLPEASAFMAETIPRATLSILAPGKHFGLIERHPDFARAVSGFAESNVLHPSAVPEIV